MLKKLTIGLLTLVLVLLVTTYVRYLSWRSERLELLQASELIDTVVGPIEYSLLGEADAPVLLALHGTPGGYDQAPPSQPGYRVLAPSRPGYLRTPLDVGRTPAEQAAACVALLDALDIERVVVLGSSGGGPSALAFAAAYPQRTSALILVEAVTASMPIEETPAMFQNDFVLWFVMSALSLQGDQAVVETLIPDPANQARLLNFPERMTEFKELIWSTWPASLRKTGWDNDNVQMANLNLEPRAIQVPTLIVHGSDDSSVPASQSEDIAPLINNSRLVIFPGADHMMPFTHPEELDEVVEAFLTDFGILSEL